MPPEPSRLSQELARDVASQYVTLTPTRHAFIHLARKAVDRFTIMVPFIDHSGAEWACELFEATTAPQRTLILRDEASLDDLPKKLCGRLRLSVSEVTCYGTASLEDETFHAKIVLADGNAAYVGSANMLRRSLEVNFECGFLVEGAAVEGVRMLVEAIVRLSSRS
jgi:phosphatidylserine/phosphatidylglycerophosphate/cardiolipin synthase-like enzyme